MGSSQLLLTAVLVICSNVKAEVFNFNLTELRDENNYKCIGDTYRESFEPCNRFAFNSTPKASPSAQEYHTHAVCVLDSTGGWNNINGDLQMATLRKTFIDVVNLTAAQKNSAFNTFGQCVKSNAKLPAEIDLKANELANFVRFNGPTGERNVRQAIRVNLCLGVALIKSGCGQAK